MKNKNLHLQKLNELQKKVKNKAVRKELNLIILAFLIANPLAHY